MISAFTSDSGYEKAGELLAKYPELDAVICATDTMAAGAVRYLREHGKKVPEDILVAGHGDSEIARVITPRSLPCIFLMRRAVRWQWRC